MKTVFFQDFQERRHLNWDVDKFLAEQEEALKLAADNDGSGLDDSEAIATIELTTFSFNPL